MCVCVCVLTNHKSNHIFDIYMCYNITNLTTILIS
jgi:hypothetical protein